VLDLVHKAKSPHHLFVSLVILLSSTQHLFVVVPILCSRMDHANRTDGSSNAVVIHKQCKFAFPTNSG